MKGLNELVAFNRGMISPLALARVDVKRVALSAETQSNWMPRVLGSMMLRPGFRYVTSTLTNAKAINIPFIFNNTDTAILSFTSGFMVPLISEAPITRVAVASAITNGTFNANLGSWTNADGAGALSQWVAGGYMGLTGTTVNSALRKQTVSVAGADQNKEHALRIVVARHTVTLRVGSADGLDDYINEVDLRTGTYSLAFTPTGDFYIQLSNVTDYQALLDSIAVEAAGNVSLPTPWLLADLPNIRWDESADVIFAACDGFQQRRIERHSTRSWGVCLYQPLDGPLNLSNITQTTLTPSAISGDITLTASRSLFRSTQVGALYSITSTGQTVSAAITGADQWSDPIRVIGVGTARTITIVRAGVWVGTVRLQSSVGDVGSWADVPGESFTANGTVTYADGLDNQIIYYRIGIKLAEYTSGTATVSLTFAAGSITGIVKITAFTSSTVVSASVLKHLGGTAASVNWAEGSWSDYRGWPTCGTLFEGRMWWAGRDSIWGSISNAYESFDDTQAGDAGPISSGIGSGPVDIINWILPLLRLLVGGQAAEHSVRSSSLDEPLTPTNFAIKQPSTQGSTNVPAIRMDLTGFFVNRTGTRLFDLAIENAYYSYDYASNDKTLFCPEVITGTIVRIAIQRIPDTRIHCVLSDGTVAVLIYDTLESVQAWVKVVTDGTVEDAFVMPNPGQSEDKVYYSIARTINGSTVRYLECWALESECQGGTLNKQCDSYITYSGAPTTTLVAAHLIGQQVVVWGDGAVIGGVDANGDPTTYTVDGSGNITIPTAVSSAVYGKAYTAQFMSTKLFTNDPRAGASGLTQKGRIDHLSLIMQNTHYQGVKYGADFDNLDPLPLVEEGGITAAGTVWDTYDHDAFEFNDMWSSDSRVCLEAQAPLPCTILGAFVTSETNVKI